MVADHQIIAQLVGNEMAKGLIRHLAHIQPVQRGEIHQIGGRLQQEVAEEARAQILLRRLAEQLAEGGQVAFVADDAEDVIGLQTDLCKISPDLKRYPN